ncbi:MAG: hypothetical protein M3Q97_09320, partial [Bacteroidota bacterium]|nr:hypothetical protein [Bacteroidota bacterium]
NPIVIDEAAFIRITGGGAGSSGAQSFKQQALTLNKYVTSKNLPGVLAVLRAMRNTSDYTAINEEYKLIRSGLVRTTIVTDILQNSFAGNTSAIAQVKAEFQRIGLKLDSTTGKWSLEGLRGFRDLITLRDTTVTDLNHNRIPVKRNTILGDAIQSKNGYIFFKTITNTIAAVPSADVKQV